MSYSSQAGLLTLRAIGGAKSHDAYGLHMVLERLGGVDGGNDYRVSYPETPLCWYGASNISVSTVS